MYTQYIKTTIMLLFLFTVLLGGLYPALITIILQNTSKHKANGSLITRNNAIIGSELIGQEFKELKYFWARPSAISPYPYDPISSTGSNLSPANPKLIALIHERVNHLHKTNPDNTLPPPIDLVTASASGLDPDISIASAYYQINRVARERKMTTDEIKAIVDKQITPKQFGLFGHPRVNVTQLNLELDRVSRRS